MTNQRMLYTVNVDKSNVTDVSNIARFFSTQVKALSKALYLYQWTFSKAHIHNSKDIVSFNIVPLLNFIRQQMTNMNLKLARTTQNTLESQ